jgi:hypothetical protein
MTNALEDARNMPGIHVFVPKLHGVVTSEFTTVFATLADYDSKSLIMESGAVGNRRNAPRAEDDCLHPFPFFLERS